MVRAYITYKNGGKATVYANDYEDLFRRLDMSQVSAIRATTISISEMRQGMN